MKQKKIFTRVMGVFLAVLMMTTVALPLFFSNASEASDKVKELQQQLNELNKELQNIKGETTQAKKTKANLTAQIGVIRSQVAELTTSLDEQKAALTIKQEDLDKKIIQLNSEQALLDSRIAAMYMTRNEGALAAVLGAEDFSQMLTTADTMQRITNSDSELLKKLSAERAIIETERIELQEQVTQMEADMALLEQKQAELSTKYQQNDSKLTKLEADKLATSEEQQAIFAEYQAAVKEMEKEFTYGAGNMGPDFISGSFTRPVPGFNYISSRFGWRTLYGKPDYHVGIDIAGGGIYGQPIVAAHAGYVTVARYGSTGYGNRVYVDGGGGVITRYGHCSSLAVAEGTFVSQGQTIAYVGSTGNSTGPHLHFEIRQNGTAVNPAPYLGY